MSRVLVRMLGGGLLLVLALASPAEAHDPIFVDDATPLSESPVIRDGSISFAVYGTITEADGSSHVRLDLGDGDTFKLEVLVPDRPPENGLDDFSHLSLTATAPDGSVTELRGAGVIDGFDEQFTNTSYLRVVEFDAPASAGTYELTVTSTRPTRFTVATGQKEQFGSEVANYQRGSLDAVATWYETPTAEPAPTTRAEPTTTVSTTRPPSVSSAPSPSGTSVAPPEELAGPGPEVGATSPTDSSDGSNGGGVALVVAMSLVAALAAGWWLSRRRAKASDA